MLKHLVDVALSYEPSIDLSVPCIASKYVLQARTVINTLVVLYHLMGWQDTKQDVVYRVHSVLEVLHVYALHVSVGHNDILQCTKERRRGYGHRYYIMVSMVWCMYLVVVMKPVLCALPS